MNAWFFLAALVALASTLLHSIGGEKLVVGPLRRQVTDPTRFAIFDVVWHLVTVVLLAATVGLAYLTMASPSPGGSLFADFLILQFVGAATIFLAITRRRFGSPMRWLRLPQWTLFVALSVLTAAGAHFHELPETGQRGAAGLAMAILLAIAALHVYWAVGGRWPGSDRTSLARTVAGVEPGGRFPSTAATFAVAAALFGAVAVVAVASGWWTGPEALSLAASPSVWRGLAIGLVAVFLLRGLSGFFEIHLRPTIAGSPYARWNVVLYSPLSLGLALLVALGVRLS